MQYADEIKSFRNIQSPADCSHIKKDVNAPNDLCSNNDILLNPLKTYSRETSN